MPRPASLALSALLFVGACRPAPEAEGAGAPTASVAGTEADSERGASVRPKTARAGEPNPASALIAVASVEAGAASPCERVCGSLGDCLLADRTYSDAVAGGLELECLDMCVHSPDAEPAKSAFLACGGKSECGALTTCAERNWPALAALHESPGVADVVAVNDTCKAGCRWYIACLFAGKPPGEAYLDSQSVELMETCIDQCDLVQTGHYEMMTHFADCLPDRCSYERAAECFDYVY